MPISLRSSDVEGTTLLACQMQTGDKINKKKKWFDLSHFGNFKGQRDPVVRLHTNARLTLSRVFHVCTNSWDSQISVIHLTSLTPLTLFLSITALAIYALH